MQRIKQMDALWSSYAKVYERTFASVLSLYCRDALVLASNILPPAPASVLDVACGTGAMTTHLLRSGFTVTATDYAQGMLNILSETLSVNNDRVATLPTMVCADGQTLHPFPNESFDAVTSSFGIPLFPDRFAGWNAAKRVLKPGGAFVVLWWSEETDSMKLIEFLSHSFGTKNSLRHPCGTAKGFRQELGDCGFDVVDVTSVHHDFAYASGKIFCDGMWANPFFSSMEAHGRDQVNERISEFFGKSVSEFMNKPVLVEGHALLAVALKRA
jgi:ubiquinone/menaquinone biosynthesis C-methylase UbiE